MQDRTQGKSEDREQEKKKMEKKNVRAQETKAKKHQQFRGTEKK